MSTKKLTIVKKDNIPNTRKQFSPQKIEETLLKNLQGPLFEPTKTYQDRLFLILQKLSNEQEKEIRDFYITPNSTEKNIYSALFLLSEEELPLLAKNQKPFDQSGNLERILIQRYNTIKEGIHNTYEYLYQVSAGKGIMSLGGLIVHPMSQKAQQKMEENFSKLEKISLEETKNLFKEYLEDRYRFVKYLPHQGEIDEYININGGRKDVRDMMSYYKKLLEIKNNPKYAKIHKYAKAINYDHLFFDNNLHALDPRYQFHKMLK